MGVSLYEGKITDYYQNPYGEVYYVGKGGVDTNGGKTPAQAVLTIAQALTLANDYDWIIVGHGAYAQGAALTIDQNYLRLIGQQPHPGCTYWYGSYINASTSIDLVHVEGDAVEISNLTFLNNKDTKNCIQWASDVGSIITYGGYLHDCTFVGSSVGEHGVWMPHGGEAGQLVIDHCNFQDFATACINSDGSGNQISNCVFDIMDAKIGIQFVPSGAGARPRCKIMDNRFFTGDSTSAKGIVFTGTPGVGNIIIDNNHFVNFANAAACIETVDEYCGINYDNSTVIAVS